MEVQQPFWTQIKKAPIPSLEVIVTNETRVFLTTFAQAKVLSVPRLKVVALAAGSDPLFGAELQCGESWEDVPLEFHWLTINSV